MALNTANLGLCPTSGCHNLPGEFNAKITPAGTQTFSKRLYNDYDCV